MRNIINYKTVIMSAMHKTLGSKENLSRHRELKMDLKQDFKFKEVQGFYDGFEELSIVIPVLTDSDLMVLQSLANHYGQDSILVLDEEQQAELVYADGKTQKLGRFTAVHEYEAFKREGWTRDLTTGVYYVTK